MANPAITNDTTPTLTWSSVSGANLYQAQMSIYSDFSSVAAESAVLASASFTPGSALAATGKHYWRWRYSTNGGSTWSVWSEKYSIWVDSTFSGSVTPTTWMLVNPTILTDTYSMAAYPQYSINEEQILRAQRRNLSGNMLTELTATKARVRLNFERAFIDAAQRNELLRFYSMGTGVFLLAAIPDGTNTVEKVWKVVFSEPIEPEMLAGSREDWFSLALILEEV